MKEQAVDLGRQIIENEKELESLFRQAEITSDAVQAQTRKIAELQGNLRNAHLEAHLEMKKILSPQQVENYNRLRGYTN
jgi:Spy/CpxP family protein refolding chaperone